jgi:hypothetical protein
MAEPEIKIEFDGGDADRNLVEMKYYALALQGAEEILSDGIILLDQQRPARARERAPILVKVRETEAGSHITPADLGEAYQMLSLGLPIIADIGADFLYNWVKAVLAHFSGRESDLEIALTRMVELNNAHLAARDRSEERMQEQRRMVHSERMLDRQILLEAIKGLGASAERFASPIGEGRSVRVGRIATSEATKVEVDEATAEAIREANKVTWEPIAPLDLETDGFKFHTNGLSVRNPEGEGWMMAVVRDPIFLQEGENSYTEAAQKQARIRVLAKIGRRGGALARLEIYEFQGTLSE